MHFLHELEANNNREWFQGNKNRYESDLLAPALEFIAAMEEPLQGISKHFRVDAKRVGGSLMRIYRDTRFAKDKTPYKTNIGIQFRHEKGKDVHAPGFYLHIEPDESFVGVGIWHPATDELVKIRKHIDNHKKKWQEIRNAKTFKRHFKIEGDSLKRPPKGYAADHPLIIDLKRKDHIAVAKIETDMLFSKSVVRTVTNRFKTASPYIEFLCKAQRLKY